MTAMIKYTHIAVVISLFVAVTLSYLLDGNNFSGMGENLLERLHVMTELLIDRALVQFITRELENGSLLIMITAAMPGKMGNWKIIIQDTAEDDRSKIVTIYAPDEWRSQSRATLQRKLSEGRLEHRAKNVIMFVGSGMGVSTTTATRILAGRLEGRSGEENDLTVDKFPYTAMVKTYCQNYQVTDTAAASTALYCGVKSNRGTVGVDARVTRAQCTEQTPQTELSSILDWSIAEGKTTGFVTVARVTEPGVSALYAHAADDSWEGDYYTKHLDGGCKDIAAQLVHEYKDIQVVLGGGRRYFMRADQRDPEDGSNVEYGRTDGRDLVEEWKEGQHFIGRQYNYVWNDDQFKRVDPLTTDALLGLFSSSRMHVELNRTDPTIETAGEPSLADMTEKAIQILQRNEEGFFLVVQGGNIYKGHELNQAKVALYEALAFDRAIDRAIENTDLQNTLIIVTADHSTGMSLSGYPARGNKILDKVADGDGDYSLAADGNPYTTLLYGTGPGYGRSDVTNVDTTEQTYKQHSAVNMERSVATGEDVLVYARGPMAHLFTGTLEQNDIAHLAAYASCVGEYNTNCPRNP